MFLLIKHIEYLLTNHDCVVVPGLGAFLGVRVPAFYDEETETMIPPYRRVAFNSDLKETDGLLINSIQKANGLDHRQATEIVRKSVEEIINALELSGEVSIGRIGRIEKQPEGAYSFVPYERDLLTPLTSCLPSFYVKQAGTLEFHKDLQKKEEARQITRKRLSRTRVGRFVRNTIGAAAAIFIGLTLSTPVQVTDTYKASLTFPEIKKAEVIAPSSNEQNVSNLLIDTVSLESRKVAEEITTVQEKDIRSTVKPEVKQTKPEVPSAIRFNESDNYIIIVGSLTSLEDANKFISNNKRKTALKNFGVQEYDGKFRVYVATSNTIDQARKIAQNPTITQKFKGAWVTRRY